MPKSEQPISPAEAELFSRELQQHTADRALLAHKPNRAKQWGALVVVCAIALGAFLHTLLGVTSVSSFTVAQLLIVSLGGFLALSLQVMRLEKRLEAAIRELERKA
jgi:protein-S-isoprenylcysteine O-methyltransferase Ste14